MNFSLYVNMTGFAQSHTWNFWGVNINIEHWSTKLQTLYLWIQKIELICKVYICIILWIYGGIPKYYNITFTLCMSTHQTNKGDNATVSSRIIDYVFITVFINIMNKCHSSWYIYYRSRQKCTEHWCWTNLCA